MLWGISKPLTVLSGAGYFSEAFVLALIRVRPVGEPSMGCNPNVPAEESKQCTLCLHECVVVVVVLIFIQTSGYNCKIFLRTSCPRFKDLQCRSCLQHVNFNKCIKFFLNLDIVLYHALGRGKKLDHVLNKAPQNSVFVTAGNRGL